MLFNFLDSPKSFPNSHTHCLYFIATVIIGRPSTMIYHYIFDIPTPSSRSCISITAQPCNKSSPAIFQKSSTSLQPELMNSPSHSYFAICVIVVHENMRGPPPLQARPSHILTDPLPVHDRSCTNRRIRNLKICQTQIARTPKYLVDRNDGDGKTTRGGCGIGTAILCSPAQIHQDPPITARGTLTGRWGI